MSLLDDVYQLRHLTDAPMMECKRALEACDGDVGAAAEWIRCRPSLDDRVLKLEQQMRELQKLAKETTTA